MRATTLQTHAHQCTQNSCWNLARVCSALKEQFAGHMKKRKALVLSSRDPVVMPSTSTLMSAAQTLAASGLSTPLVDMGMVNAPHAKQFRPNVVNAWLGAFE